MKALRTILQALPASFSQPIVTVLHRHRDADDALVHLLQTHAALSVSEALDKEPFCAGHVYVAPPDYHLLVETGGFSLSTDEPVQFARPSIDVLFESAADNFGAEVIAVILTGANHDGAAGAARIQERGGTIIIQDPSTAESPIMPLAAIETTRLPHVRPPEEIAPLLLQLTGSRQPSPP
jgi:two-component system chemotaxis response regulator CheB